MAYTRAWSDVTPADSDQASTLGLAIRNLRTDIEERMNTLTNGSWDADPVAAVQTMKLNIPASMAIKDTDADWVGEWSDTTARQGLKPGGVVSKKLYVPVVLPQGVTMTEIKMAGKANNGGTVLISAIWLGNMIATMDTASTLGSSTSPTNNGGWLMVATSATDHIMADGDIITVEIHGNNGGSGGYAIYGGLEVTYTRPLPYLVY